MAEQTAIAWTDHTANYWMGCEKVSPGCAHCYAETLTTNRMGLHVFGPAASTARQPGKAIWANVRKWDKAAADARERKLVFVMSLGDFMEDHSQLVDVRARAWDLMAETSWLDYQILTKRPENYARFLPPDFSAARWPHIWLGTSIENNRHVGRADILRQLDARVRFLSLEPLLGPLPSLDLTGIHWAIVGGESGPGYRPMEREWVDGIAAKCGGYFDPTGAFIQTHEAATAFFYKQSAAYRTEMGIQYRGRLVRNYPPARLPLGAPYSVRGAARRLAFAGTP
jgi:protein gp37